MCRGTQLNVYINTSCCVDELSDEFISNIKACTNNTPLCFKVRNSRLHIFRFIRCVTGTHHFTQLHVLPSTHLVFLTHHFINYTPTTIHALIKVTHLYLKYTPSQFITHLSHVHTKWSTINYTPFN